MLDCDAKTSMPGCRDAVGVSQYRIWPTWRESCDAGRHFGTTRLGVSFGPPLLSQVAAVAFLSDEQCNAKAAWKHMGEPSFSQVLPARSGVCGNCGSQKVDW